MRQSLLAAVAACGAVLTADVQAQMTVIPRAPSAGELGLSWSKDLPSDPSLPALGPALVTSVTPCSPAHLAGVLPGDLILTVNGRDSREAAPFPSSAAGTVYSLVILRLPADTLRATVVVGDGGVDRPRPMTTSDTRSPAEWNCAGL